LRRRDSVGRGVMVSGVNGRADMVGSFPRVGWMIQGGGRDEETERRRDGVEGVVRPGVGSEGLRSSHGRNDGFVRTGRVVERDASTLRGEGH
jgi:hypothetical protein